VDPCADYGAGARVVIVGNSTSDVWNDGGTW